MRRLFNLGLTLLTLALLVIPAAQAEDLTLNYIMSVGDFYKFDYEQVNELLDSDITIEELPVVCFIAQRAGVAPKEVVEARAVGQSWQAVTSEFNLNATDYYVIIHGEYTSREFRIAFDKFHSRLDYDWKNVVLDDADIINLVNLRFIYQHHDFSPFRIMTLRDNGADYSTVNYRIKMARAYQIQKELAKVDREDPALLEQQDENEENK